MIVTLHFVQQQVLAGSSSLFCDKDWLVTIPTAAALQSCWQCIPLDQDLWPLRRGTSSLSSISQVITITRQQCKWFGTLKTCVKHQSFWIWVVFRQQTMYSSAWLIHNISTPILGHKQHYRSFSAIQAIKLHTKQPNRHLLENRRYPKLPQGLGKLWSHWVKSVWARNMWFIWV